MMKDSYLDDALSRKIQLLTEMIKEKEADKATTRREREIKNAAVIALKAKRKTAQRKLDGLRKNVGR